MHAYQVATCFFTRAYSESGCKSTANFWNVQEMSVFSCRIY